MLTGFTRQSSFFSLFVTPSKCGIPLWQKRRRKGRIGIVVVSKRKLCIPDLVVVAEVIDDDVVFLRKQEPDCGRIEKGFFFPFVNIRRWDYFFFSFQQFWACVQTRRSQFKCFVSILDVFGVFFFFILSSLLPLHPSLPAGQRINISLLLCVCARGRRRRRKASLRECSRLLDLSIRTRVPSSSLQTL